MTIKYDRNVAVEAIGSYYKFLATIPAIQASDILEPPTGGWPSITTESLAALGKDEVVVDLLRHLPYIGHTHDGNKNISYDTAVINYSDGRLYDNRSLNSLVPTAAGILPAHVVSLTIGARYGSHLLLDTQEGTITDYIMMERPERGHPPPDSSDHWLPKNKGREGMTYLTFIIDNYSSLPEIVIFLHAERYQWHNDDPLYDGVRTLSRLQIPYVLEQGYVNLRCVWTLGCPTEIRPLEHPANEITSETSASQVYAAAFQELFPGIPIPESIGVSCCAQFAVTRETILRRPREDYEKYRRWLLETGLEDGLSGRVLEYSWHVIFGKEAVFCPRAEDCYCKVYGLCDLHCDEEGKCQEQYTLPPYSTLPQGWPWYGWDGQWQNASAM
ncbi:hypothetical protein KCU65_g5971, partial [Aureobasidium melanogenum]